MNQIRKATPQIIMPSSVTGAIEILNQGYEFLCSISDSDYLCSAKPHITSSIGEHTRHTLDLFHALITQEDLTVDYNTRRRGHAVENERTIALSEIQYVINWLKQVDPTLLSTAITIETEVSMNNQVFHSIPSNIEREITFAALHANHHYAMIKVIATFLEIQTCHAFGYAPTTASYLREQ